MIRVKSISANGASVLGIEIEIPEGPPLLVIVGRKGFVACGYLDIKVADKLDLLAATIPGVGSVEEMLDSPVKELTERARKMGLRKGMLGRDVISLIA